MEIKMKMKKITIIKVAIALLLTLTWPVLAAADPPDATEVNEAYKNAAVDVRVRAEVPEDFTGTVSIQFTGQEFEGFTAVLDTENNYTLIVPLPRDLYTYKQHSIVDGYDLKVSRNFILDDAILNDIYLLPVIVSAQSEGTSSDADMNYVTAKLYASPQGCDFTGSVEMTYSGTNGNGFRAILSQDNEYAVEIPILKDLYTLKDILVSDGYEADTLYSFSTSDSNHNQKYQMAVKVYHSGEAPVEDQAKDLMMKQAAFQLKIPDSCTFSGDVVISYTGNRTYPVELILKSAEGYTGTIDLPVDTYLLNYAVSYDDITYTFDLAEQLRISETDEIVTVPVAILKDGAVLTDLLAADIQEEEITIIQEGEIPEEPPQNNIGMLIFTILVVIMTCVGIWFLIKNKNHRNKTDSDKIKEESPEDQDLFLEDEI